IDLARDSELLALCVEAGLTNMFIGIETPNEDSLAETSKRQNLRVNLTEEVSKVVSAGVHVMSGGMVGFDHDGPDIFERQAAFIDSLPVPLVTLGVLVASSATPLYARMEREGRLDHQDGRNRQEAGRYTTTNFRLQRISEAQLKSGMEWLLNHIYSPHAYGQRVKAFADIYPARVGGVTAPPLFAGIEGPLAHRLAQYGKEELNLLRLFQQISLQRPDLRSHLRNILIYY